MSSTTGSLFQVTTFGESHGAAVGAVVDGCLPGLPLGEADIQPQLDRRRPGQSDLTTSRGERDRVRILSGLQDGRTMGTPICMVVENADVRPADYAELRDIPRPSHADYTYLMKYGVRAVSGGGRASARETVGRVAAGAVAERVLAALAGVEIVAWVSAVETCEAMDIDPLGVTRAQVDANAVRCPGPAAAEMAARIRAARDAGDSVGGTVSCVCRNVPPGWGEPVFDKLEAALGAAVLSIPACRGVDFGSGFAGTRMRGSAHNDVFAPGSDGCLVTASNRSGGIQGGISNGQPVLFRVAFKPVATIGRPQSTCDYAGMPAVLEPRGRHDPCVLPRAVPVVEAMAALVLADMGLQARARNVARAG